MLELSEVWTLLNWRTCRTVEVTAKISLTSSSWTTVNRRIYRPRQLNHKGFIQGTQVFTCIPNISYPQVSDPLLQASHMNASVLNDVDFLIILNRPNYHAQPRSRLPFSPKKVTHFSQKHTLFQVRQWTKSASSQNSPLSLNWKFSNILSL